MVRGPYVLDGEHYIALEDPALVLESRIRMQPRGNVMDFNMCASFHILCVCVCVCVFVRVSCESSEAQHPGRASLCRCDSISWMTNRVRNAVGRRLKGAAPGI